MPLDKQKHPSCLKGPMETPVGTIDHREDMELRQSTLLPCQSHYPFDSNGDRNLKKQKRFLFYFILFFNRT